MCTPRSVRNDVMNCCQYQSHTEICWLADSPAVHTQYSGTCPKDHLYTKTTCPEWPLLNYQIHSLNYTDPPLYEDHLSTETTFLDPLGGLHILVPLYLVVLSSVSQSPTPLLACYEDAVLVGVTRTTGTPPSLDHLLVVRLKGPPPESPHLPNHPLCAWYSYAHLLWPDTTNYHLID